MQPSQEGVRYQVEWVRLGREGKSEEEMRSLRFLLAAVFLTLGGFDRSFAQPPSPATLESLVTGDEAAATTEVTDAGANARRVPRPVGTAERPDNGVPHPDLDKAWAEYEALIAKVGEELRVALSQKFDEATAKGDLDAAEKWQSALEKFENAGEVPSEPETKAAVSTAVANYKKAREELTEVYESVVKSLTMDKKIAEAKLAREELQSLGKASNKPAARKNPQLAAGGPQTTLRRGDKIADFICTVADDFVIDIYVNGELVPAEKRKLTGETYGAQAEQIDVPIHRGDWVVFAVANNRLRWGGSYFFGAAGMTKEKRLVFQSKLGDPRWTYTDDPASVSQFVRQRNMRGRPVESVKVIWDQGHGQMKERTNKLWSGDPVWGASRLSWIKFIVD